METFYVLLSVAVAGGLGQIFFAEDFFFLARAVRAFAELVFDLAFLVAGFAFLAFAFAFLSLAQL